MIVILGPTASGKTRLAVQLASRFEGEIISADSRQVYRGMDIGTGKDLSEYTINGQKIPYHLIDICEAGEKYNLARFQVDFPESCEDIRKRGKLPVLCGGSGLYLQSVLQDLWQVQVPVNPVLRDELQMLSKPELMERYLALDQASNTDTSTSK